MYEIYGIESMVNIYFLLVLGKPKEELFDAILDVSAFARESLY
jgi:hypothetical protein